MYAASLHAHVDGVVRGELKGDKPEGTNRAQTQIFANSQRFSQVVADAALFHTEAFGSRRFSQETADFAGFLRFVP